MLNLTQYIEKARLPSKVEPILLNLTNRSIATRKYTSIPKNLTWQYRLYTKFVLLNIMTVLVVGKAVTTD